MVWTRGVGLASGLLLLSGCVYGYSNVGVARYSVETRPDDSYYCYDCHGYRYFDPYYDYCAAEGFRYRWDDHPRVMQLYRERYVRIRESHPDYGRYRYGTGYKSTTRYREGTDYEKWRAGREDAPPAYDKPRDSRRKNPEQSATPPGKSKGKSGESKRPKQKGRQRFDRGGQ